MSNVITKVLNHVAKNKKEAKDTKTNGKKEAKKVPAISNRTIENRQRREYLFSLIQSAKHSQREIVEKTLAKYPHIARTTASTLISDLKNSKYVEIYCSKNIVFSKTHVDNKSGIYQFINPKKAEIINKVKAA